MAKQKLSLYRVYALYPCFSVLVGEQDTMHATYESALTLVVDCFLWSMYIIVLVAFTRDLLSRFL